MTNLELVVRPHESLYVGPRKRTTPKQKPEVDEAVLEFGSAGDDVFTAKFNRHTQVIVETETHEVRRHVDIIRVKNKDNPENYVDVESVRQIVSQSAANSGETGKQVVYYNPMGDFGNVTDATYELRKKNRIIDTQHYNK